MERPHDISLENFGEFLEKLAEKSDSVYWLSSPDFKEIIYISPAYEKIWGRSREILFKEPELWITYLHPDDVENHHPIHEMADKIAKLGPSARYEENYRIIRPNGEVRWIIDKGFPIYDQAGHCCGVTGVAIDITEQKEADKLRAEKAALEKQLESSTLLGASIAHELRTPLLGIKGYADIFYDIFLALQQDYVITKRNLQSKVNLNEKYLSMALQGAQHVIGEVRSANEFINMLLMNITSQNISNTSFQVYSIHECVEEALNRYPFEERQKQLIHFNKDEDFKIKGSLQLVVHILFNLLKNALFFIDSARKGEIYITTNVAAEDWNYLIFRDTGLGVSPDRLPYIFERFRSYRHDGAGVGLTFCKRVMEAHGGDIICHSEFGKFTEFVLSFRKEAK